MVLCTKCVCPESDLLQSSRWYELFSGWKAVCVERISQMLQYNMSLSGTPRQRSARDDNFSIDE